MKKIAIAGGGGVFEESPWFLGGSAKKPCLSTRGEGGVKNVQKSVHMVYGCPLGKSGKLQLLIGAL